MKNNKVEIRKKLTWFRYENLYGKDMSQQEWQRNKRLMKVNFQGMPQRIENLTRECLKYFFIVWFFVLPFKIHAGAKIESSYFEVNSVHRCSNDLIILSLSDLVAWFFLGWISTILLYLNLLNPS